MWEDLLTPRGINRFRPAIPKHGNMWKKNRQLDARFRVKCSQESAETNASAPTVQLQSIRAVLGVIAYTKWNFREADVSRGFLRFGHLKRGTYAGLPNGADRKM